MPMLDSALKLRLSPQVRGCEHGVFFFLYLSHIHAVPFEPTSTGAPPSSRAVFPSATPPAPPARRDHDGGRRCMGMSICRDAWSVLNTAGRVSPRAHPRSVSPQQYRPPRGDDRGPGQGRVQGRTGARGARREGAERGQRRAGERVSARRGELRELYVLT